MNENKVLAALIGGYGFGMFTASTLVLVYEPQYQTSLVGLGLFGALTLLGGMRMARKS